MNDCLRVDHSRSRRNITVARYCRKDLLIEMGSTVPRERAGWFILVRAICSVEFQEERSFAIEGANKKLRSSKLTYEPFGTKFKLQQWRLDRSFRRHLVKSVALEAIEKGGRYLESCIAQFKAELYFRDINTSDQEVVNQNAHYIRTIARNWALLDEETQTDFVEGRIPPSTLSKTIKELPGRKR